MCNTDGNGRAAHEEHGRSARPPEHNRRPGRSDSQLGSGHAPVVVASSVDIASRYVLEVQKIGGGGRCHPPQEDCRHERQRRNAFRPEPHSTPSGFVRPEHQECGEREPGSRTEEITGPHGGHEDGERAGQSESPHREVCAAVRPHQDRYGPERQVLHGPDGVVQAVDDPAAVPDPAHRIGRYRDDQYGGNAVSPGSPQDQGALAPLGPIRQAVPRPG